MATMFLAGPGTQAASPFFAAISLITGAMDTTINYFTGQGSDVQNGQFALDVASELTTNSIKALPGARPASVMINTLNHATDVLSSE
jgi:hypothetical protein